jgi:hypothetical protein
MNKKVTKTNKNVTISIPVEIADTIKDFADKKCMRLSGVYQRGALLLLGKEGEMYDT